VPGLRPLYNDAPIFDAYYITIFPFLISILILILILLVRKRLRSRSRSRLRRGRSLCIAHPRSERRYITVSPGNGEKVNFSKKIWENGKPDPVAGACAPADNHSSRDPVAGILKQPVRGTAENCIASHRSCFG
jgi:hypothetical protein